MLCFATDIQNSAQSVDFKHKIVLPKIPKEAFFQIKQLIQELIFFPGFPKYYDLLYLECKQQYRIAENPQTKRRYRRKVTKLSLVTFLAVPLFIYFMPESEEFRRAAACLGNKEERLRESCELSVNAGGGGWNL